MTAADQDHAGAIDALLTLRDWLRYAVTCFEKAELHYGHGTDNAWDEAVFLLLDTLHLPPDQLEPFIDARLLAAERRALLDTISQRVSTRRPAAYLTGQAWLHGLSFICDERALVPRSLLVEALHGNAQDWIASLALDTPWPAHILDLCCGGGSIAIHAALIYPDAQIVAADISEPALALAHENLARHGLTERVSLVASDLADQLQDQSFDLILCNPPYVPQASMQSLPREYQHEPVDALQAGTDGMQIIVRLMDQAANMLSANGALLIELGHETQAFEATFDQLELTWVPVTAGEQMIVAITRDQLDRARS